MTWRTSHRYRSLRVMGICGLLLALTACGGGSARAGEGAEPLDVPDLDDVALEAQIEIGESVADVSMTMMSGETLRLGDYAGHVIMLIFWSTDSSPALLRQIATHNVYLSDEGFVAFAINSSGEPLGSIENFIDDFPNDLPVVLDEDQHLMRLFGAGPETLVWIGPLSDLKAISRQFRWADLYEENIRYRMESYFSEGQE